MNLKLEIAEEESRFEYWKTESEKMYNSPSRVAIREKIANLPFIVTPFIDAAWGHKWSLGMLWSNRLETVRRLVEVFWCAYESDTYADYKTPIDSLKNGTLECVLSLSDDSGKQFFNISRCEKYIEWSRGIFHNDIVQPRTKEDNWNENTKKGKEK